MPCSATPGFKMVYIDMMDAYFKSLGEDYHKQYCKKKDHCYFQQHGIA